MAVAVFAASMVIAGSAIVGSAVVPRRAAAIGAEAARVGWTLAPMVRPGEFQRAQGVAVAPDGTVFVTDAGAHRIQRLAASGVVETVFGMPGAGDGQLSAPAGLDVGPDGTIWVADQGNGRIAHFDRDGRWLGAWPSARRGEPSSTTEPPWVTDVVALPDGTVVVIGEVLGRYAADGRLLARWSDEGAPGAPGLEASSPPLDPLRATAPLTSWRNVLLHGAAAPDGTVWVESSPGAVHFDMDGRVLGRAGGRGTSPGMFYRDTEGIGVDAAGNVHLVDTFIDRVHRFAPDGRLLGWWTTGERGTTDLAIAADGSVLLAGGDRGRVDRHTVDGHLLERWGRVSPAGAVPGGHVAVGPDGRVVVPDPEGGRLQVYGRYGRLWALWGAAGDGPGRFDKPWGQAFIGDANTMVVTDAGIDRIVVLASDGGERGRFGVPGAGGSALDDPRGVAVSPATNRLAIADPGNHRVARSHLYGGIGDAYEMDRGVLVGLTGFTPIDVALAAPPRGSLTDETLFAADVAGNRIVKTGFHSNASFIMTSGGPAGVRPFLAPEALALDPNGLHLYVADTGHHRIQRVATSGSRTNDRFWGRAGRAPGTFDRPTGVDVAPDRTVVVHDAGNRRIQRFDVDGNRMDGWPLLDGVQPRTIWPDIAPLPEGGFVTASSDPWRLLLFDAAGRRTGAVPLASPDGRPPVLRVLVGALDGTVWYADAAHQRIVQIERDGREVRVIATPGEQSYDDVQSFMPAADGAVFAHFSYPERVEVFDRRGRRTASWPVGTGVDRIVLAPDGTLLTTGASPGYLLRYRRDGAPLEPLSLSVTSGERLLDIAPMADGGLLIVFDKRVAVAEADGYIQRTLWLPGEGCAKRSRERGETAYLNTAIPLSDGAIVASWSTGCLEGWLPIGAPEPATWRVSLHPDSFGAEPPVVVTETAGIDLAWSPSSAYPEALVREPGFRHLPTGGGSASLRRTFALTEPATLRLDVTATGGLRLWADDTLVIDRPVVRGPDGLQATAALSMTAALPLDAGRHVLEAVYETDGRPAAVRIDTRWGPAPTATSTAAPTAVPSASPVASATATASATGGGSGAAGRLRRVWLPHVGR